LIGDGDDFHVPSFTLRNTGTPFCQAPFFGHYGIARMLAFPADWRCWHFWQSKPSLAENAACSIPGIETGNCRETRQACTGNRGRDRGGCTGIGNRIAGRKGREITRLSADELSVIQLSINCNNGVAARCCFCNQRGNEGKKDRLE
jgi:hypothetical protein